MYNCHGCLRLTCYGTSHADSIRLRRTLQNQEIMFNDREFFDEYPILIFDLPTSLIEEPNTVEISKGQLLSQLPHLQTFRASKQYKAAQNVSISVTSVISSTVRKQIQYLLLMYEDENEIVEALYEFNNNHQT